MCIVALTSLLINKCTIFLYNVESLQNITKHVSPIHIIIIIIAYNDDDDNNNGGGGADDNNNNFVVLFMNMYPWGQIMVTI